MNACGDSRLRGLRSRKPIGFRQWVVHYDQEKHIKQEKEESWEEGRAQGIAQGITQGRTEGIQKIKKTQVERKIKKGLTIERIAEDLECSQEEIATIIPHNISPTAHIT